MTVSCGDDATTQPAPNVTSFEQGVFASLPTDPRSDPLGPRIDDDDGTISRSYRSIGATPRGIIDFYAAELASTGWEPAAPIPPAGALVRGDWIRDDYRLEVTASQIRDRQNPTSTDFAVQYNLVLRPR
jgi:hypothetical protein